MAQDSAYPLVEPRDVDVSAIERELEEIWRCCAEAEGGQAVMRAAAFTLIYAVRGAADGGMINDMLVELTLRHPSRAILLHLNDEAGEKAFRAWVTAYCHRPAPGAAPVCSDFVTLEACKQEPSAVVSTLLSLFRSGMPTVLAWDSSLPSDHPVLLKLGSELERVIVSAISPCAPASKLATLFALTDALGGKPIVTDLAESFVRPWQMAVAGLFDADPSAAQRISHIQLSYSGSKIPAEMLLLAAWMSVILGWKTQRITLHGHSPAIVFAGDHIISFATQSGPEAKEAVDFYMKSANGEETTLRCEEPSGENRLTELLHLQLQIWGRDPLRDESLHRARLWLKELLFS
jgi:glucose-6-phosphate dehydrogenase assembly protein OpcA